MPTHRTEPLRRLLLRLTLVGLIPLAALTGLSLYEGQRAHKEEVARATLDLARAVSTAVHAELDAAVWSAGALTSSNELMRRDFTALHEELARFAAKRPDVVGFAVSDAQGRFFLRSNAPVNAPETPSIEPESLQRAVRTLRPAIGGIVKVRTGEFAYAVRVPLVENGTVRYVVTAGMRPERIRQIIARQQRGADWVISVFDADLRRVARSRDPAQIGGAPAPSLRALVEATGREGVGRSRALEGDEVVTGIARVPEHGWVVAVGAPVSILSGFSKPNLLLYAVGLGASLLLAIVLARSLTQRVQREIDLVVEQARAIGAHDKVPAGDPRIGEMAVLMEQVTHADARVRAALAEATRANAAKDQFLAVLGHELRNPLAPITNVLSIFDLRGGSDTAREREILRRQVRHMTRLVDDLLDVSRLTEGKLALRREDVDVRRIAGEVVELFSTEEAAALHLQTPAAPVLVSGDPARLTQAVSNLVVNALRHGAGKQVHVAVVQEGELARIVVRDQGEGMADQTLARAFEPFYQEHALGGRLGLGLPIVKGIVERHGGTVRAESGGPGAGSTFTIELPLLRASAGPPAEAASAAEPADRRAH